jgi:chorismate mutase
MVRANGVEPEDVAAAIFTTTPDLNAEFPGGRGNLPSSLRWPLQ